MWNGGYICFCTLRQGMDCSLRFRQGGLACAYRRRGSKGLALARAVRTSTLGQGDDDKQCALSAVLDPRTRCASECPLLARGAVRRPPTALHGRLAMLALWHHVAQRTCSHVVVEGAHQDDQGARKERGCALGWRKAESWRLCCLQSQAPATLDAGWRVCARPFTVQHVRRTATARSIAVVVLHIGANGELCAISRHDMFELARAPRLHLGGYGASPDAKHRLARRPSVAAAQTECADMLRAIGSRRDDVALEA